MPTQQHGSRLHFVLLRNLQDQLLLEEWPAGRAERAVGHDMDTLLLGQAHDIVLRQRRVVLELVHRRYHLGHREELLQVPPGVVGDAHGAGLLARALGGIYELLHLLPRVRVVVPLPDDVARPVGELGELVVVALRVHEEGPVDQV